MNKTKIINGYSLMLAASTFFFGIRLGNSLTTVMNNNNIVFAIVAFGGPIFLILANILYGKKFAEIMRNL